MSLQEPPPPLDSALAYQSVAVRPSKHIRRFTVVEIVSWTLIFLAVTFVAWRAAATQSRLSASNEPDISLSMRAQYTLGIHILFSQDPVNVAKIDQQAMQVLDKDTHNPEDQFRVAILAGELNGSSDAIARLQRLAQSNPELAPDIHTAESLYGDVPVPQPELDRFHQKYRWFSDLLQTHGKDNTNRQRAGVEQRAFTVVVTIFGGLGLLAIVALAGIVLSIIALIRLLAGKVPMAFSRSDSPDAPPANRSAYVAGMAVYIGGYVGLSLALRYLLPIIAPNNDLLFSIAGVLALSVAFLAGFLLPLVLGQSPAQWKQAFGLTTGRGVIREMLSGVVGYLTGMPLMIAGGILVLILTQYSHIKGTHPIVQELSGSPWELFFVFFLACVFAPVTEELMFRGALFSHLRERFNWFISAVVMGVIFALVHPQSWVALPVLAAIAIVFAGIREWRQSILASITAHALHNGAALALSLLLLR